MDSSENLRMGATFTLRNIEFPDGQIMLINGNMVMDGGAESSRSASIGSQAFNFAFTASINNKCEFLYMVNYLPVSFKLPKSLHKQNKLVYK